MNIQTVNYLWRTIVRLVVIYFPIFILGFGLSLPIFPIVIFRNNISTFILLMIFIMLTLSHFNQLILFGPLRSLVYIYILFSFSGMLSNLLASIFFPNYFWSWNTVFILLRIILYIFFIIGPFILVSHYNFNPLKLLLSFVMGSLTSCIIWMFPPYVKKIGSLFYIGENTLGLLLIISFFVLLFYFFENKHFFKKILFGILLLSSLVFSAFTWSKGTWLCITIGYILFSFLKIQKLNLYVFVRKTIIFIFFIIAIVKLTNFGEIAKVELSASSGSCSNEERMLAILEGIRMSIEHFFLGVGSKNYSVATELGHYNVLWIMPDPHNAYIHILTELGLVSLLLFLFFSLTLLKITLKLRGMYREYLFAMLFSFLLYGNFSGEIWTQPNLYFFSGIIVSLNYLEKKKIL